MTRNLHGSRWIETTLVFKVTMCQQRGKPGAGVSDPLPLKRQCYQLTSSSIHPSIALSALYPLSHLGAVKSLNMHRSRHANKHISTQTQKGPRSCWNSAWDPSSLLVQYVTSRYFCLFSPVRLHSSANNNRQTTNAFVLV